MRNSSGVLSNFEFPISNLFLVPTLLRGNAYQKAPEKTNVECRREVIYRPYQSCSRSRFAVAGLRLKKQHIERSHGLFSCKVGSEKGKQGVETNIQMLKGLHKFAEKNRKL